MKKQGAEITCEGLPESPKIAVCTFGLVRVESKSGCVEVSEGRAVFIPACEGTELRVECVRGKLGA